MHQEAPIQFNFKKIFKHLDRYELVWAVWEYIKLVLVKTSGGESQNRKTHSQPLGAPTH